MLNDITLGQYFPGNSPIHRMDPRMKLILTILYIVGVFIVANLPGYAIALAFLYIVVRVSGIKFSYLAKGVKPLRFIIIFTFILNLFFVQGETPIFTLGFFTLTKEALNNAIYFALRLIFLVHAVHDALADKLALEAPQIQLAQIRRHTVQRGRVAGLAGTACLDDGLIVSRKGSAILELHPAEQLRQQAGFGVETGQQGLKAIQRLGHIAPRHRHIAVRHRDLTGLAPSDMRPAGPQGRGQLLPRMQALPGSIELPRQHGGLLVVLGDKIARDVPDRS